MNENELVVRCDCGDIEHNVVFSKIAEDNFWILFISVANGESSLAQRIKIAWRVLLYGRAQFSECVINDESDVDKILEYINKFREEKNEKTN